MEGGWPKEIDYSEAQDTLKYRKRLEKDPSDQKIKPSVKIVTAGDHANIRFQENMKPKGAAT